MYVFFLYLKKNKLVRTTAMQPGQNNTYKEKEGVDVSTERFEEELQPVLSFLHRYLFVFILFIYLFFCMFVFVHSQDQRDSSLSVFFSSAFV